MLAVVFSEDFGLRPGTDGGEILLRAGSSGLPNSVPRGAGDTRPCQESPNGARGVTPTARTKRATVPPEIAQILLTGKDGSPGTCHWIPAGALGGDTGALVGAPAGGD